MFIAEKPNALTIAARLPGIDNYSVCIMHFNYFDYFNYFIPFYCLLYFITELMHRLTPLCLLLAGCNLIGSSEKCNPDFNSAYYAGIEFELLDVRTSQNLLDVRTGVYHPDSVKIYNATRNVLFAGPVRGDGIVSFSPLELESERLPYDIDLQREYYLRLNSVDLDTFSLSFRLQKNDCGFAKFERYALRYNGKEVAAGQGLTIPNLILYKR